MNYVVAVSGGIDSVVLLHMMTRVRNGNIVVAHFDHGIRSDSARDAAFVAQLAQDYGVPFVSKQEELGAHASEELARTRRYAFLQSVAREHDATLVTAHHVNDVVETIAINLSRGTGWRGLAVLGDVRIRRPLLMHPKAELRAYAKAHGLQWCEDSTNNSDAYLRNRLRASTNQLPDDVVWQLAALRQEQVRLVQEIDLLSAALIGDERQHTRNTYICAPVPVALELLRTLTHAKLTRPQLERLLLAIKTALPGKTYQAGTGIEISFSARFFTLEVLK